MSSSAGMPDSPSKRQRPPRHPRHRSDPPSVLGDRRSRLRRDRRARDPRAGSHRPGALGRTRHGRLHARPTLPSRGRDGEGPVPIPRRSRHCVGQPGCCRPRHRATRRARRSHRVGARCRRDGRGTVKSLAAAGTSDIFVANRTWDNAVALVEACGGTAVNLDAVGDALVAVDMLVTTTGAQQLTRESARSPASLGQMANSDRRCCRLRDVDPRRQCSASRSLTWTTSVFVEQQMASCTRAVGNVETIVGEEVDRASHCHLRPRGGAAHRPAPHLGQRHRHCRTRPSGALRISTRPSARPSRRWPGHHRRAAAQPTIRLKDAAGHARGDRSPTRCAICSTH